MSLRIGYWIRGMHLERLFQNKHEAADKVAEDATFDPNSEIGKIYTKAVSITEAIKNWVKNPFEDLFIKLLPKIVQDADAKLEQFIPIILAGLTNVSNPLGLEAVLKNVKFTDNFYWDKFFHDLAVGIANVLSDGKIDFADISVGIQFIKDTVLAKTVPSTNN